MTTTTSDKRKQLIRLIHVAKRELKLSDDAYREALSAATNGKTSSAKMTIKELESVMASLKNAGFKQVLKSRKKRLSPPTSNLKVKEINKIRALWIVMFKQHWLRDGSETALNNYVKRITSKLNDGEGIANVGWLDSGTAYVVLEALKNWHRRLMMNALTKAGKDIPLNERTGRPAGYDAISAAYIDIL